MGAAQGTDLNTDTNLIPTTGYYADPGDGGGSKWFHWFRIADGGHATAGAKADAAVTDPTSSASIIALLKGLLTFLRVSAAGLGKAEDAAHVSGDTGVLALAVRRDTAAVGSSADGDNSTLNVTATGRLRTIDHAVETGDRVDDRVGALSNARTTALAETLLVKASAGTLFGVQGYTDTDGYVQVHADADGTLSGGAQALEVIKVTDPTGGGAGGPFSLDLGIYGIAVATGITLAFSSTGPTYTAGGSHMFASAQYE